MTGLMVSGAPVSCATAPLPTAHSTPAANKTRGAPWSFCNALMVIGSLAGVLGFNGLWLPGFLPPFADPDKPFLKKFAILARRASRSPIRLRGCGIFGRVWLPVAARRRRSGLVWMDRPEAGQHHALSCSKHRPEGKGIVRVRASTGRWSLFGRTAICSVRALEAGALMSSGPPVLCGP